MNKLLFAFAAFITGSCIAVSCCKVACVANEIDLDFSNYQRKELDTVVYLGYERGSNFTLLKDSTKDIIPFAATDTNKVTHGKSLQINYDWVIKVVRSGKIFQVKDYVTAEDRCSCGNTKYEVLLSYTVNGITQQNPYFKLPK